MNTPFHHPFRIDGPTLTRAANAAGFSKLINATQLPENVRFVAVNPAIFTHAYLLLGEQPQRFVSDLTLYLTTVRTFFERADAVGGINVPAGANSDSKRRLSEDLGVALAAFFMVEIFGVTWESISQIPANTKLSKKRPDFQGFTLASQRFLFEAKGTTKLQTVEKTMSKALDQVKKYPEVADAKIAIVSYLSADERYFPSTSFVVDPPALPEEIKPDAETSQLLHFEKVLQFAGLSQTAKDYVTTLSQRLKEEHRVAQGGTTSWGRRQEISRLENELNERFATEKKPREQEIVRVKDAEFLGRIAETKESKLKAFFGADKRALETGVAFKPREFKFETHVEVTEKEVTTTFSDGTILRITGFENKTA